MKNNYEGLTQKPYRIQGMFANNNKSEFYKNIAFATFEEAEYAAEVQARNSTNIASENSFIIFKAVAVVGVVKPPTETTLLDT